MLQIENSQKANELVFWKFFYYAGLAGFLFFVAEREGFEPPDPCGSTVFKTAAIDHSAISPYFIRRLLKKIHLEHMPLPVTRNESEGAAKINKKWEMARARTLDMGPYKYRSISCKTFSHSFLITLRLISMVSRVPSFALVSIREAIAAIDLYLAVSAPPLI